MGFRPPPPLIFLHFIHRRDSSPYQTEPTPTPGVPPTLRLGLLSYPLLINLDERFCATLHSKLASVDVLHWIKIPVWIINVE